MSYELSWRQTIIGTDIAYSVWVAMSTYSFDISTVSSVLFHMEIDSNISLHSLCVHRGWPRSEDKMEKDIIVQMKIGILAGQKRNESLLAYEGLNIMQSEISTHKINQDYFQNRHFAPATFSESLPRCCCAIIFLPCIFRPHNSVASYLHYLGLILYLKIHKGEHDCPSQIFFKLYPHLSLLRRFRLTFIARPLILFYIDFRYIGYHEAEIKIRPWKLCYEIDSCNSRKNS